MARVADPRLFAAPPSLAVKVTVPVGMTPGGLLATAAVNVSVAGDTAATVISEAGYDMSKWKTENHFVSWLRLCPDNRISGNKVTDLRKRWQRAKQRATEPQRHYNFTDPASRMMWDNGVRRPVQGYNAQLGVDAETQVILAADVTQQVTDQRLLRMVLDGLESM